MKLDIETKKIEASIDQTGIGWLIFNNPDRHNALSLDMWKGIGDAFEQFNDANDVRAVIMRGAGGKAFVSGADISEFDKERANALQRETYGEVAGRATHWLNKFEKPLIALVEGYCIGGGLATALSADIRFASPDSKFGIPAAKLGLGYEYEGLAKLARVVGPSRARDIMFSARFMVSRDKIQDSCVEYASLVAANAPLTVKAAKAALNAWERGGEAKEVVLVKELVDACFNSEDYKEGRRAFGAKEKPVFKNR